MTNEVKEDKRFFITNEAFAPPVSLQHCRSILARQLVINSGPIVSCDIDGHTQMSLRIFDSPRFATEVGGTAQCLSLTNIEVSSSFRRQGIARTTLSALSLVAGDSRRALIVENVVSEHMHTLISELNGKPLYGCRLGSRGCHYFIPPSPDGNPCFDYPSFNSLWFV